MRQFSRRLLICRGTPDLGIEACPASRTELLRLPGEVTQVFTTDKFISRGTLNRSVHGTVLLAAWCFEAYASAATGPEPGRAPLCCCTFGFERSSSRHTPPTENLIVEGTNIRASQSYLRQSGVKITGGTIRHGTGFDYES